jgi:hypothetical protein
VVSGIKGAPAVAAVKGVPAAQSVQSLPVTGGGNAPGSNFGIFGLLAAVTMLVGGAVLRRRFSLRR